MFFEGKKLYGYRLETSSFLSKHLFRPLFAQIRGDSGEEIALILAGCFFKERNFIGIGSKRHHFCQNTFSDLSLLRHVVILEKRLP